MILSATLLDPVDGVIRAEVTIADQLSRSVCIAVEVSDGGPFRPARVFSSSGAVGSVSHGGFGLASLSSDPDGITHVLAWDSIADIGYRVANVELRFTPYVGSQAGLSFVVGLRSWRANTLEYSRHIQSHMLDLGAWSADKTAAALRHDVVVVNPAASGLTLDTVQTIQAGLDPNDHADDVLVLGAVFACQDMRARGISDPQLQQDARFNKSSSGPRVDPRPPSSNSLQSL